VSTLRILIADDHDVVRQGLRALLETQPGWEICGEAATGREAVEKTRKLKPDIVLLDIIMPELNGLEALRRIRKARPETQVLVLTMHESEDLIGQALKAGARGFMLKSDAGRDLITAIDALSRRKPFFTSKVAQMVLEGYLEGTSPGAADEVPRSRLSAREREIVQLLAEGRTNKQIAASLEISTKTVETHRSSLMRKLNLHSVGELTRYAIRNKIIEP
jgi:DNA-binding NarL/FixJ family response regulator